MVIWLQITPSVVCKRKKPKSETLPLVPSSRSGFCSPNLDLGAARMRTRTKMRMARGLCCQHHVPRCPLAFCCTLCFANWASVCSPAVVQRYSCVGHELYRCMQNAMPAPAYWTAFAHLRGSKYHPSSMRAAKETLLCNSNKVWPLVQGRWKKMTDLRSGSDLTLLMM